MSLNLRIDRRWFKVSVAFTVAAIGFCTFAQQAMAHHLMGGRIPANFFEGFLSGLAHPIIGLDHFAFVVASGLLAVGVSQGILIPVAFVLATLMGTGIHLQKIDLPFSEMAIAVSVVLFGVLLALRSGKNHPQNLSYTIALIALATVAGVFHGYAYGEAIVGAQMAPLAAYLAGFTLIQLTMAIAAWQLGQAILEKVTRQPVLRWCGLAISAIGLVFLTAH